MDEARLLSQIISTGRERPAGVIIGPGDDCAVVEHGGVLTLLTVDQVIEGRHFRGPLGFDEGAGGGTGLSAVAHKAIARSVSDVAAMGGRPRWALATGALSEGMDDRLASGLFEAMRTSAASLGCPLVGGDIAIASGPLMLTVTVGGSVHPRRGAVLRSTAEPGDSVYVTGRVGGSFASGRHLSFTPRVEEGAWLADVLGDTLTAMIDLSDGVGLDADRVGVASGVRLVIDALALPLHAGVQDWRAGAADGEDYELLFTARGPVPERCPATGTIITRVGRVERATSAGCVVIGPRGEEHAGATLGFVHRST